MKVLIIKTSSLGDVIHTLPALSDARQALGNVEFDWVVEEGFADIPRLHPAVRNVIPVALRRWRKNYWKAWRSGELKAFLKALRKERYDAVIDAQGLFKSALLTRCARGLKIGLNRKSAREGIAAWFYNRTIDAPKIKVAHAVVRMRTLFAKSLGYAVPQSPINYGLCIGGQSVVAGAYIVFLHGTTWATKHWPDEYWCALGQIIQQAGLKVVLSWGNELEKQRAEQIAAVCDAEILPKLKLTLLASVLRQASAVVAVDTGLAHLAAALDVPCLTLYGPTDPKLTGTSGPHAVNLAADFVCAPCLQRKCTYPKPHAVTPPCYQKLPPQQVWRQLQTIMASHV